MSDSETKVNPADVVQRSGNLEHIFGDAGFSEDVEQQAEWREDKAKQYPDDQRNQESADELRELAKWIEANPQSPLLARLNDALDRLYESDSLITFDPSVRDRLGRMGFGYGGPPEAFIERLAEDIQSFIRDAE